MGQNFLIITHAKSASQHEVLLATRVFVYCTVIYPVYAKEKKQVPKCSQWTLFELRDRYNHDMHRRESADASLLYNLVRAILIASLRTFCTLS